MAVRDGAHDGLFVEIGSGEFGLSLHELLLHHLRLLHDLLQVGLSTGTHGSLLRMGIGT